MSASGSTGMNGAESLVRTLLGSGVNTCFANPGTSEMHFVAALDQIPGMRCVLGLQENIVTGMADGYFRIAGNPACTLLHCGPGLANGLANLHNARRAGSAIVNIVGDQATYHRPFDAPLTADTDGLARTVSSWVRTSARAADVGRDAAAAVHAARIAPGNVTTLILPSDSSWEEGGIVADCLQVNRYAALDPHDVDTAADMLRRHSDVLILLGGQAVLETSQRLAWRIARATGASVMLDWVNGRVERGLGRLPFDRVPYSIDVARKALDRYKHIILVNCKAPVSFFAYPGKPSTQYAAGAQVHVLSRATQNSEEALAALAEALKAPEVELPQSGPRPEIANGKPTPEGLARTVAAVMPDQAIISDESVSFGRGFYAQTFNAPPHDWLHLTGGAIGDGLPVATGAAIAAGGERRVIGLQADGSAMYSLQSLWTQARERLPVTTIILSNKKYNILIGEYEGVGAVPGETAMNMLDLGNPCLDWVKLAQGMGVDAAKVDTMEGCAALMTQSFTKRDPFLIELLI
ncbi:acetolactate synthase large subunit [Mesorhizobium sp.]|uniref:acetolactate synthase large subunit n=1 Tax=Mesorhizobium sp. TaxID=1871066 RepID=UPI0026A93173